MHLGGFGGIRIIFTSFLFFSGKEDEIQPYEQPLLSCNDIILEVHESEWLSASFTLAK